MRNGSRLQPSGCGGRFPGVTHHRRSPLEHQHTEHIAAAPDAAFTALADVNNLPEYVPQVTSAEAREGDTVEVSARYGGHEQRGEAWFRSDGANRTIEWGAGDRPSTGACRSTPTARGRACC